MSEKKNNSQKTGAEAVTPADTPPSAETVVKQRLFILKAKPKNLKNAEQFLKNRDIEIVSTADIKIAINTILSGQASFIMLSTDHANPKVMKLPAIIQQTLNTPIILFAEGVSPKGAQTLRESRHPYILYPPVSGPAVERMILKIERDRKEKANESSGTRATAMTDGSKENGTMKFAGSFEGQKDDIVMQNKKAQQEFAKVFAGEGMGEAQSAGGFSSSSYGEAQNSGFGSGSNGYSLNQQSEGNGKESDGEENDAESVLNYLNQNGDGQSGDESPQNTHNIFSDSESKDGSENDYTGGFAPGSNLTSGTVDPIPEGFSAGEIHGSGEADGNENDPANSGGIGLPKFIGMNKKGDQYRGPKDGEEQGGENHSQFKSSKSTQHVSRPEQHDPNELTAAEALSKKGANLLTFTSDDNASFLIKGSKHALESSSKFVQGKKVRRIQTCTKVSCFSIESSKFSGYVIVAFGEKDKVDQEFNKSMKSYLCEYLKINGLEINLKDMTALTIKEVNFEEWSIREADFLMTSIHEGSEIALAFFPHENKEAPLELSAKTDMAKMTIDEIVADEPIEFDVYIYLPTNDKYVRYTPQNGIMYGTQKERLKSRGHAKIHIRKEAESSLSRYRVQNFLNDKIESFKKAKKTA